MASLETLIEQVRAILIQTEDSKPKHELYNQFINECKASNLTEDDFYKKVLKAAHKSIDWNYIEEEKKKKERELLEKEKKEKEVEKELEEVKKQIKYAPAFIDRLIKTAFEGDVVTKDELIRIFDKADRLSQNTYELAEKIDAQLNEKKYKSYPKANFDLPSLRQTLCSADWHNEARYTKLTTPPKESHWGIIITAVTLILLVGGSITYFSYLKPKWRDDAAPRYYTFAEDASLRKSQVTGVASNFITRLSYGSDLITYDTGKEWYHVKFNGNEGYVSSTLVLDSADFYLLNSIFGDQDSRQVIETVKCRKALLEYFKNHNYIGIMDDALQTQVFGSPQPSKEVWQVFSKRKDEKTNTTIFPKKLVNPNEKYTDFGVIIKNIKDNTRKFLLFTFTDDDKPLFVYEEPAPTNGDIIGVKKKLTGGAGVYEVKYTTF